MLPAPGQAALGVECRLDDPAVSDLLQVLEDESIRKAITAERQFLQTLGGGCAVPVAAFALAGETIQMQVVASADGKKIIRVSGDVKLTPQNWEGS